MESLRCVFTQIGIIFKHDLRLSKCQSWCSVSIDSASKPTAVSFWEGVLYFISPCMIRMIMLDTFRGMLRLSLELAGHVAAGIDIVGNLRAMELAINLIYHILLYKNETVSNC